MVTIVNAVRSLSRKLRSRTACAAMLTLVCLSAIAVIAANIRSVNIIDSGETKTVITMRHDTKTILNKAGYAISVNDEVIDENVSAYTREITILRASTVTITENGNSTQLTTVLPTVQEVLDDAGILPPDEDDVLNCELTDEVYDSMNIVLDRVEYKTETITEVIPYETVEKKTSGLSKGTTKVSRKGKNGSKDVIYSVKYVNGEPEEYTALSETVTKKPVNKKVLVGTYSPTKYTISDVTVSAEAKTISVGGETFTYSKIITGTGTAYTADPGALCSTGKVARVGYVAVNPKKIPYGTKMFIVSSDGKYVYGYAEAADTGGALMSNRVVVDLYMNTEKECYAFGRRGVKLYILD